MLVLCRVSEPSVDSWRSPDTEEETDVSLRHHGYLESSGEGFLEGISQTMAPALQWARSAGCQVA